MEKHVFMHDQLWLLCKKFHDLVEGSKNLYGDLDDQAMEFAFWTIVQDLDAGNPDFQSKSCDQCSRILEGDRLVFDGKSLDAAKGNGGGQVTMALMRGDQTVVIFNTTLQKTKKGEIHECT